MTKQLINLLVQSNYGSSLPINLWTPNASYNATTLYTYDLTGVNLSDGIVNVVINSNNYDLTFDGTIQGLANSLNALNFGIFLVNGNTIFTQDDANTFGGLTFPTQSLNLLFDDIANANTLVGDATNVNDWNTFFDLPTYGNPFTSVVVVGNEVQLIGGSNINMKPSLFYNGTYLLKVIDNANCIVAIEGDVFGYQSFLNEVSFPVCITTDFPQSDYGVFAFCESLASINMPLLQVAGQYTFYSTGCTYFNLPELTTVVGNCFYQETSVPNVVFNLPKLENVTTQCFYEVECESLILPSVTIVESGAFFQTKIKSISLPSVTDLSATDIFIFCLDLESVNLPLATTLGDGIFTNCTSLDNVNLPLATTLGNSIFVNCYALDNVNLPNVTTISNSLFANCTSLTNFSLPLITTISEYCFSGCTSLIEVNSTKLPLVTTINNNAFNSCTSLNKVNLPLVTFVDYNAFLNIAITSIGDSSSDFYMPSATEFGIQCFNGCLNLTSINISNNVYLNNNCFDSCSSLTTAIMPNVTSVGASCFIGCISLSTIDLSSCVNLGGSVYDDGVFSYVTGNTITLTIPSSRMTCNGGNPDGDIAFLQANDTVTVITV